MDLKPQTFTLREDKHAQALFAFLKNNRKACADNGKPLVVTVAMETHKRSLGANAYYWGVTLRQIAEQAWIEGRTFPARAWHEHMRDLFAPRLDSPFGKSYPMSTTDMNEEQFSTYVRDVETFAMEQLGVRFLDRVV